MQIAVAQQPKTYLYFLHKTNDNSKKIRQNRLCESM